MSCRNAGSSGLPGLARAWSTLGGAANGGMCRRCHHLISDPVRFPFVDIPRLVHREFGLQTQSLLLAALLALPRHTGRTTAGALALQYPALAGAHRHRRGGWAV